MEVTRKPEPTSSTPTSTPSPTKPAKPSPTQEGLIESCTDFYFAVANDNCQKIAKKYGTFTEAQFIEWNPAVGSDCGGIWAKTYYCVGIPGTPTAPPISTTVAPSSTAPAKPSPTQEGLIESCTKFYFAVKNDNCANIVKKFGTFTLREFVTWNPAVGEDCGGIWADTYYCVGIPGTPSAPPSSSVVPTTVKPTPTGNGISTPLPTQPNMVSNCNKFHYAAKNVGCGDIISYEKITLADFAKWNPSVLADCSGMWAEVNVCVGVIGGTTTPTATPTTITTKPSPTTTAGNGIQTPQPTQPGMITNCNKFHWVAAGNTCSQILSYEKITLADFFKWNPTVKSDCSGMQALVNVCVGAIGATTTTKAPTTTTSAGNGIQTPQPTQPGMVTNCKKFHYVAENVTCDQIISYNKITLANFVKWNSGVGSDCKSMWAKTNVCVGV